MRSMDVIRPKQAHRVLCDRDIKGIYVFSCCQVIKKSLITKLISKVFVCSNLNLQYSTVVGLIFYFEQFYEISLHKGILDHFAFGEKMAWNRDLVVCTRFFIVINCPDCHQVILWSCIVLELVNHETSHVTLLVVFQGDSIIKFHFSSQNPRKLFP